MRRILSQASHGHISNLLTNNEGSQTRRAVKFPLICIMNTETNSPVRTGIIPDLGNNFCCATTTEIFTPDRLEIISGPQKINMAEDWFDIATADNFWMKRRFDVARRMLDAAGLNGKKIVEVGCGHGLLQKQVEDWYRVPVDGIDLNLQALQKNVSRQGRLYFYNIFEKRREFEGAYDVVLLFDVLEHIEDQDSFLEALKFLMKPNGTLVISVPALRQLFSKYDLCAGHVRRYSLQALEQVLTAHRFTIRRSTYWGIWFTPLLWVRKYVLRFVRKTDVIRTGCTAPNRFLDNLFYRISRLEPLPQRLFGTSAMALAVGDQNITPQTI
jgi:2-polyprenyl-3-methyl-5-hydroxy-6-metoxy-1,4-benzoquinol methylase